MMRRLIKIILQVTLIYGITLLGMWLRELLHIPIAGSIVGLALLFCLLLFKVIPEHWIEVGANKLINVMVLFFVPSIVGIMDIANQIDSTYIFLAILIIISTSLVALSSGYVSEKLLKIKPSSKEDM
ncbi:CidA/LrgA family protein [Mammaliicoccus lentus]|uniref:CidA/LrgA family protein n=1 Tax=Mammaliicoccus lentus TaxID=42858 RepID=UPI002DBF06F8|nr:CidA/LrgA family protein [Mammaliicoccus lentus]MEB8093335.1 CidA/LrgA family protein [Mammaliicoccus lentus]